MSIQAESTWPRAVRTLAMSLAVLGAATLSAIDAQAATNTVDFVTRIGQCNSTHIDKQGNDADLQVQAGTTKFELWADFIENVNSISVRADDSDPGTVTASIGTKRNGAQNTLRGCPFKGSVEVTVTSLKSITANLRRELILKQSGSSDDYRQGVNIKAIPQFDLTFSGTQVPACLVKTGTAQYLENNKKLEIHLPAGHLTDQTNCTGTNDLLIKIPEPRPSVSVDDDYAYTLTPDVTQAALTLRGITNPVTGIGTLTGTSFVEMQNPPSFFTVNTSVGLGTEGFVPQQLVRLILNPLALRSLTKHTKIQVTVKAPNNKSSDVLIDVFPAPPPVSCGILSGAASPSVVDTGNLVDFTTILTANAPACAPKLTFKVTTASCFLLSDGSAPPAVRGVPGVGVVTSPPGQGVAPGFKALTLRAIGTAPECVGTGAAPSTATQRVEFFIGDFVADPTVLDLPIGPSHIQISFAIRKNQ